MIALNRGFGKPLGVGGPPAPTLSGLRPGQKFEKLGFCVQIVRVKVSHSVKLIVDAYVSLKDRQAIEDLREHRQMLRKKLQACDGIDVSGSLQLIESDLSEIEAGFARLQ